MQRLFRLVLLPAYASLVVGFGACGRSDLFSERHSSGGGGNISIDGGGGSAAARRAAAAAAAARAAASAAAAARAAARRGAAGRPAARGSRRHGGGTAGRGGAGGGTAGRGGDRRYGGRGGPAGTAGRGGVGGGGRGGRTRARRDPRSATTASTTTATTSLTAPIPGCFGDPRCAPLGQEVCNNNLDDDEDGRIDCADPDCMNSLSCRPDHGHGDLRQPRRRQPRQPGGLRGSAVHDVPGLPRRVVHGRRRLRHHRHARRQRDARRWTRRARPGLRHLRARPAASAASGGSSSTRRPTSASTSSRARPARTPSASSARARTRPATAIRVDCVNAMDDPSASKTFSALAPGVYWIIVESYPNLPGTTSVTLSTGSVTTPEICANGIDDDGNGLVDCAGRGLQQPYVVRRQPVRPRRQRRHAGRRRPRALGDGRYPHRDRRLSVDLLGGRRRRRRRVSSSRWPRPPGWRSSSSRPGGASSRSTACRRRGSPATPISARCSYQDDAGTRSRSSACPRDATCSSPRRRAPPCRASSTCGSRRSASARVEICGNKIDDDSDGLTDCDDPECFGAGDLPGARLQPFPGPRQLLVGNAAHGQRRYARSA